MYQVIIFGSPGVGKGTQAELTAKKLNLLHLSTGEYLRKAIIDETELGRKAKEIVESGKLVPDDIMTGIVKEALDGMNDKSGFILDGFPRTINQAESLSKIFGLMEFNGIHVLYLTAEADELVSRLLKRGRNDDTEDIIRKRLKIYEETTKPVMDYYKKLYKVSEIYGVGEIDEINDKIIKILSK